MRRASCPAARFGGNDNPGAEAHLFRFDALPSIAAFRRRVACRESRTAIDWAEEIRQLLEVDYSEAEVVTVVCDNLNTHHVSSLYKAFNADTAGRLRLVQTPVNGSWLNIAEMELSVLSRQCLGDRRFATQAEMERELAAWTASRNAAKAGTRWQFTTNDARVKLRSLYPLPDIDQ